MDQSLRDNLIRVAIAETRTVFIAALGGGDAKAASAVYAEKAVLLPPSAAMLRGRGAIEAFWQAGIDAGLLTVELETLQLAPHADLAYEIGGYALELIPQGGKPVTDRGKYLLVHERQADGAWKWAAEMFNPNGKDH